MSKIKKSMLMTIMMGMALSANNPIYGIPQRKCSANSNYKINRKERKEREFTVKGKKVMAYSRKDALIRLRHKK